MTSSAAVLASGAALAAARPTKDDISLAAWSLNRSFFVGHRWKNLDLPKILREEFNINGLEFVNQFFENPTLNYLSQLKRNLDTYGITPVLIMVDSEGNLAGVDRKERIQAVIAHRKWVDTASYLGCHAIRCNLGGSRGDWKADKDIVERAAESFSSLLEYAEEANVSVVVENHGGASSDADVLVSLMKTVGNPNFGTLPDFGNINQGDDRETVIRKIVPYAKGISVKASWTPDGTHPGWDLDKLIAICQEAGYHGFWGIESGIMQPRGAEAGPGGQRSATQPSPDELWATETKAVRLTKAVLERAVLKKTA